MLLAVTAGRSPCLMSTGITIATNLSGVVMRPLSVFQPVERAPISKRRHQAPLRRTGALFRTAATVACRRPSSIGLLRDEAAGLATVPVSRNIVRRRGRACHARADPGPSTSFPAEATQVRGRA
jgi:hypothetical protein